MKKKNTSNLKTESANLAGSFAAGCLVAWSLNTLQKLNHKNYHGIRSKCVPFRQKPSRVKNVRDRKTFRGYTRATKLFINTQFC